MLHNILRRRSLAAALLGLVFSASIAAAPLRTVHTVPVHIVKTDLTPLIRAAVQSPDQFAVLVPHAASTATAGTWRVEHARTTWTYAVRVPTAVSLSFHAVRVVLPPSALLVVRGATSTTSYRASDLHRGELWTRIHPGEALQLTLTVAAAERDRIAFAIDSLQAGYRGLGPGVHDHPVYRRLKAQAAAATDNTACITNYSCEVTPANTPPGAATVALIIGNLFQCTGSLINDVPNDNTPYLLTARHCETGTLGGGNPGAASTVTVYWDEVSACAGTLGSIYDPTTLTQTGAQTIVEQQDAWLIQLDANPVATDAQFAGFDASAHPINGGYTIHHAEGNDKQYTGWFGRAAALHERNVAGSTYASDFWETVNQLGNIGPGASGSGLFDQNNRLVGTLSLGRQTSDPSAYDSCPVTNPPMPNGSNGAADFTSLAAVWNSTSDTTSSTGAATLKSVLDPANTGTLVEPSLTVANISLTASPATPTIAFPSQLTWSAAGALQCTASGGVAGDGWSGVLAAAGTQQVTESSAGEVTYLLSCRYPGGRTALTPVMVTWEPPIPSLTLTGPYSLWTTRPALLSWTSNVSPCALSGGGLALTGLAANDSTSTTQTIAGEVTYTLTCGPGGDQGSTTQSVIYVTPSLVLEPTGTDRILGQTFDLQWRTSADSCIASGGAPNDGWQTTAFTQSPYTIPDSIVGPTGAFKPTVTTLGTYTYTLTCTSGPISVQQSVAVTFENDVPYTTASLSNASVMYSNSPADYATVVWNSNISTCQVYSVPYMESDSSDPLGISYQAQSSATFAPPGPGTYTITVTCAMPDSTALPVTSAPLTLTVLPPLPPTATIAITPATVDEYAYYTLTWSSTNSSYCARSGGGVDSGWDTNGIYSEAPTGTFTSNVGQTGQQLIFTVTCESISPSAVPPASAQTSLSVGAAPVPTASLQANVTTVTTGNTYTLSWTSTNATACAANGGGANGTVWIGSLTASGSVTQTATTAGSFIYSITCSNVYSTSTAATVTIVAAAPANTGSGKSGGGGSLDAAALALLATLLGLRFARVVTPSTD